MMRNTISSVKLEEKVHPLGDKNVPFRDEGIKQYTQMYILYHIQCDVKKNYIAIATYCHACAVLPLCRSVGPLFAFSVPSSRCQPLPVFMWMQHKANILRSSSVLHGVPSNGQLYRNNRPQNAAIDQSDWKAVFVFPFFNLFPDQYGYLPCFFVFFYIKSHLPLNLQSYRLLHIH